MNRRTLLYCLIIGLSFIGSEIPVHAQVDKSMNEETRRNADRARRVVQIKSTLETTGINSGLVIVYGHPIPKPYQFEYRGDRLFMNGIQVEPSLAQQHEYDQTHHALTATEAQMFGQLQDLEHQLRKYYSEQIGKSSNADLHKEILNRIRAHPLIRDAQWIDDGVLHYWAKDASISMVTYSISFVSNTPRPSPSPVKSPGQAKADHIKALEDALKKGKCVFFLSDGGVWQGRDIRKEVRQVMEQPGLSTDEKESRLREVFHGAFGPHVDTIANYHDNEWK